MNLLTKIKILGVTLILCLALSSPALAGNCPQTDTFTLPPLHSENLTKVENKIIEGQKLRNEKKSVSFFREQVARANSDRKEALCEIEEALSQIKALLPQCVKTQCFSATKSLNELQEKFRFIQRRLLTTKDVDSLALQLMENRHDAKKLYRKLSDKKMKFATILREIGLYDLLEWKPNTFKAEPPEPDPFLSLKGIFLYVHWLDDPEEARVVDRATVESQLQQTDELFREFSYNNFRPEFDICEVQSNIPRPDSNLDSYLRAMVELCDEDRSDNSEDDVDFSQYDWVILYPTWGNVSFHEGREDIETNDGNFRPRVIRISTGSLTGQGKIIHEGGHALRLRHAHVLDCGDDVFGESCVERSAYGNPFDRMGTQSGRSYNCAYKKQLGWTTSLTTTETSSELTIPTIDLPSEDPHCIKLNIDPSITEIAYEAFGEINGVDTPCEKLYIEYRKPFGWAEDQLNAYADAGYFDSMESGALGLYCVKEAARQFTWLLDCTPNSYPLFWTHDRNDSLLEQGETCETGLGYKIRFEALPDNKAKVFIEASGT